MNVVRFTREQEQWLEEHWEHETQASMSEHLGCSAAPLRKWLKENHPKKLLRKGQSCEAAYLYEKKKRERMEQSLPMDVREELCRMRARRLELRLINKRACLAEAIRNSMEYREIGNKMRSLLERNGIPPHTEAWYYVKWGMEENNNKK